MKRGELHPLNSHAGLNSQSPAEIQTGDMRLVTAKESLLTAQDVAVRLNVSIDWVWDHSSRKAPYLPVIRMSDGVLRYRASEIETFILERERLSTLRRNRRKAS